jgi:hypothetical protein
MADGDINIRIKMKKLESNPYVCEKPCENILSNSIDEALQ